MEMYEQFANAIVLVATVLLVVISLIVWLWKQGLRSEDEDLFRTYTVTTDVVAGSDDGRGCDAYYASLPKQRSMMYARWTFEFDSEQQFRQAMQRTGEAAATFIKSNLPVVEKDWPVMDELPGDWNGEFEAWPRREAVEVVQFRFDALNQTLYMSVNHKVVGGGDFLRLGAAIFCAEASDLIKPPSLPKGLLCVVPFVWWMVRQGGILRPQAAPILTSNRPKDWATLQFTFAAASCRTEGISTRVAVAHKVLSTIAEALHVAARRPLRVWFPVGFQHERTGKSHVKDLNRLNNSVGIIPFLFSRGMSAAELNRAVSRNALHALGSYQLLSMSMLKGKGIAQAGSKARTSFDVVVSMGQLRASTNGGDQMRSAICQMACGLPYSTYAGILTVNDHNATLGSPSRPRRLTSTSFATHLAGQSTSYFRGSQVHSGIELRGELRSKVGSRFSAPFRGRNWQRDLTRHVHRYTVCCSNHPFLVL